MQSGPRAVALALALVVTPGCGLMMNGFSTTVKVSSPTPGAKVYINGGDIAALPVSNFEHHVVIARAPGMADKVLRLSPKVQVAPIILDIVAAVPSLLIAPAMDLMMNMWFKIDPSEIGAIALEPAKGIERTAPEQTAGIERNVADEYGKSEVAGAAEYGKGDGLDKGEYGK